MWWYYKRTTFNWTSHSQYEGTSMKEYDIQKKISGYKEKRSTLVYFIDYIQIMHLQIEKEQKIIKG
jgi:hypothetical protein